MLTLCKETQWEAEEDVSATYNAHIGIIKGKSEGVLIGRVKKEDRTEVAGSINPHVVTSAGSNTYAYGDFFNRFSTMYVVMRPLPFASTCLVEHS